jgi:hypothetical protein
MPRPVPTTQTGSLTDNQHGTNDTLVLGTGTSPSDLGVVIHGDALAMYDDSRGGNDTLVGGANAYNGLFGDAHFMYDNTDGGNDTLIGGDGAVFNFFLADASDMYGNTRGGNDTLIGGANTSNLMFGDTFNMYDNARGGNDTLIGSAFSINGLFGDAFDMRDNARGGDDTLISGTGTDHMWGDGQVLNGVAALPTAPTGSVVTGADTFVFAPGNGDDFVYDLRQADHDRIDVSAWGFQSLADMTIVDTGADTRIEFDAANSITLVGFGDPALSFRQRTSSLRDRLGPYGPSAPSHRLRRALQATAERHDVFRLGRQILVTHQRLGSRGAGSELVLEVRQHLLQIAGVERLPAAGATLEWVAVAGNIRAHRALEMSFQPFPYHEQRTPIPDCRLLEEASCRDLGDRARSRSRLPPLHRSESANGAPTQNGSRYQWRRRRRPTQPRRWPRPSRFGCRCRRAR